MRVGKGACLEHRGVESKGLDGVGGADGMRDITWPGI